MLPSSGRALHRSSCHLGLLPATYLPAIISPERSVVRVEEERKQDILESSLWRRWKAASTWQPHPC